MSYFIDHAQLLISLTILIVGMILLLPWLRRSYTSGFSIRFQVFLAIVLTSALLSGAFGLVVVRSYRKFADSLAILVSTTPLLSVSGLKTLIAELAPNITLLALILAVVAALFAIVIGRFVGRPIERLTQVARDIANGNRRPMLPPPRGREVRQLTDAVESMRRALEERHEMETFVADLSHELKNPVSVIRAAAELLIDQPDPMTTLRLVSRIADSSQRLEALVADLLILTRIESHGIELIDQQISLADVAQAAILSLETLGAENGVFVSVDAKEHVEVMGNRRWLTQAAENLIKNALIFSPRGGTVTITISRNVKEAILAVTDHGPGVDSLQREKLFSRFFTTRLDSGGTGLGLSIVRAVAEAHGGTANYCPREEGGATFRLVLPIA